MAELNDFCDGHGIPTDEYWQVVVPVEERICTEVKGVDQQMRQKPGRKRARCSPRELVELMGYDPLPFYPTNISMLVALAVLCGREGRDHDQA